MPEKEDSGFAQPTLSDRDFHQLSRFIEENLGIRMPASKRIMLESRLSRRLRQHSMKSYSQYIEYLFSEEGMRTEIIHMIDAVTTNKTDFFREADHFDYLLNRLLPEVTEERGIGFGRPMQFWSAGCSTGEEPYTLAMVLEEFKHVAPGFSYAILATDISTRALEAAANAIYEMEKVAPVPVPLKKKYMLKGKDPAKPVARMKPEIRVNVSFKRVNLMDDDYGLGKKFDVIFCRNVIIYFDRKTQERLLTHLYNCLEPGGTLFLGHSETLAGMNIPFKSLAPTIYRRA
jgi:chemotaxis protein methyltransferase CheR